MTSAEQEIVAAAREVAALFVEHPFVPRTWAEVQRFVAAVAQMTAASPVATSRPFDETPAGLGRQQDQAAGPSEPEPEPEEQR